MADYPPPKYQTREEYTTEAMLLGGAYDEYDHTYVFGEIVGQDFDYVCPETMQSVVGTVKDRVTAVRAHRLGPRDNLRGNRFVGLVDKLIGDQQRRPEE
jgi:hypothetical protein